MAQAPNETAQHVTEEAFLADRKGFWESFCSATTASVIAVVILLVLMAIFLV